MTLVVKPRRRTTQDLSRFLDDYLRADLPRNGVVSRNLPAVNVIETNDAFVMELATPGLGREDLTVHIDQDLLTISAKEQEQPEKGPKVHRREFNYQGWTRRFRLPETIDASSVEAAYEQGILRLTLAKKDAYRVKPPRQIAIG